MSIRYRGLAAHETKVDDDEELKKAKADQVNYNFLIFIFHHYLTKSINNFTTCT